MRIRVFKYSWVPYEILCLLLGIMCISCTKDIAAGTYLSLNPLKGVDNFTKEIFITKSEGSFIPSGNGSSFRVMGDTLLEKRSTQGYNWLLSDLATGESWPILPHGRGHNELSQSPNVNNAVYWRDGDTLKCRISDFSSGNLFVVNINFGQEQTTMRQVGKIAPNSFNSTLISDTSAICNLPVSMVSQKRVLVENGQQRDLNSLEAINSITLPEDEDINILSTSMVYDANKGIVLEAPIMLNTLFLYDIAGGRQLSLFYGREPMSIESVIGEEDRERQYTFESPRILDNCFSVLWFGKTKRQFFSTERGCPEILFFDMQGNGKAKITFDFPISYYDYDERSHKLYVRCEENDEILCFDNVVI